MDKRIIELRDRLYKKKAALQQKENLPVSINIAHHNMHTTECKTSLLEMNDSE